MKDLPLRSLLVLGLLAASPEAATAQIVAQMGQIAPQTTPQAAAPAAPPPEAAPESSPETGRAPLPRPAPARKAAGAAAVDPPKAPAEPPTEPAPDAVPDAVPNPAAVAFFTRPAVAAEVEFALAEAEAGDFAGAARRLDARIAASPGLPEPRAARAALAMLAGVPASALDDLEAAADAGLSNLADLLAGPLFAPLAADPALAPRAAALAARPPAPGPVVVPAPVPAPEAAAADRDAPITAPITAPIAMANTAWLPETGRLAPRFAFAATPPGPVLPARPKVAALDILREHWKRGRAAGNWGDLYDNRDRGHSRLDLTRYPQLAATAYDAAARAAEADYGLQEHFLFDRPTFGNSSTAVTDGALWRSLPRLAMTEPDGAGPLRLWQNASANALYVYPAHKDYRATTDGATQDGATTDGATQNGAVGDLFPANTPYLLVSAGSSGSDQPFLDAVALILASFRPDTKAKLTAERLIVPTVQMVLHRSLRPVTSRALYMSATAWPAAIAPWDINTARMVSLANAIRADAIPPQVRLRVESEDLGIPGVDFFGAGLSEQLFDTPGAIARVWRSKAARRSMVVSAAETRDPNGRELALEWRLMQGDPRHVTIEPLDGGTRARITLDWTPPFPISPENPIRSARVDIGVFASNGVHDSAPAILSWYMPPSEVREIETGPDGAPRTAAIRHAAPGVYADPMLVPHADWTDRFTYGEDTNGEDTNGEDGGLTGWVRSRSGAPDEIFAPDGSRLPEGGGPAETVTYPLERDAAGRLVVRETGPRR